MLDEWVPTGGVVKQNQIGKTQLYPAFFPCVRQKDIAPARRVEIGIGTKGAGDFERPLAGVFYFQQGKRHFGEVRVVESDAEIITDNRQGTHIEVEQPVAMQSGKAVLTHDFVSGKITVLTHFNFATEFTTDKRC